MNDHKSALVPVMSTFYEMVPGWQKILNAVREGEQEFLNDLKARGLDKKYGVVTSQVHAHADLEPQGFIVGLSGEGDKDIRDKAYYVYGSHWFDDFVDCPKLVPAPKAMFEHRKDVRKVLQVMGDIGEMGFHFVEKSNNKDLAYRGLHKMIYGGLIQRSTSVEERTMLLEEFVEIFTRDLDPTLAEKIQTIQSTAYLMTNKVDLEFINSTETDLNINLTEAWDFVLCGLLNFHDSKEEQKFESMEFTECEKPREEEFLKMIDIALEFIQSIADRRKALKINLLEFAMHSLGKTTPELILTKLSSFLEQIKK